MAFVDGAETEKTGAPHAHCCVPRRARAVPGTLTLLSLDSSLLWQ